MNYETIIRQSGSPKFFLHCQTLSFHKEPNENQISLRTYELQQSNISRG